MTKIGTTPACPNPAYRSAVSYIDRTREYYQALGYEAPYRWAHFDDVPFHPLARPLTECRVSVITTASPARKGRDSTEAARRTDADRREHREEPKVWEPKGGALRAAKQVWSQPTDPAPSALFTNDLPWDKQATHTEDIGSILPLRQLQSFADEGRIGSVAARFHGVPTDYSQRQTMDHDAPEILRRCREDAVDLVLLNPL